MNWSIIAFWSIGVVTGTLIIMQLIFRPLKSEQSRHDATNTAAMMLVMWVVIALFVPTDDDTWLIVYLGVVMTLLVWNAALVSVIVRTFPSLRESSQKELS